jgi:uncharacterized membrane protein YcfT
MRMVARVPRQRGSMPGRHRAVELDRSVWVDTAKGVCILLVVLWHVIMKHYLMIDWHLSAPIPGAWGTFGDQMLTLRMPLFFAISGLLAAGAVSRPWRVLGRSKVAKFLYLYILWSLIHAVLLALVPGFDTTHPRSALDVVEQLTITPPNVWYLYALALYFVVAKVTRTWPTQIVLGLALALSVVTATGVLDTPGNRAGLLKNLVFFLGGLHFGPAIKRLAADASGRRLAVVGGGWVAILAAMALLHAKTWPGVWAAASLAAVIFGVNAAAIVARWTTMAAPLAALGRRTLPIYVMHMPLLALLHRSFFAPLSEYGGDREIFALLEPAGLTALLTALCLGIHYGLQKARAGWLFELPGGPIRPAKATVTALKGRDQELVDAA